MRIPFALFTAAALLPGFTAPTTVRAAGACPNIWVTTNVPGPPSRRGSFTLGMSTLPAGTLTYAWTISAGTIVRGAGQKLIIVDAPIGPVTATVKIGGMPAGCATTASGKLEIK